MLYRIVKMFGEIYELLNWIAKISNRIPGEWFTIVYRCKSPEEAGLVAFFEHTSLPGVCRVP